jgi:hypothetical protein
MIHLKKRRRGVVISTSGGEVTPHAPLRPQAATDLVLNPTKPLEEHLRVLERRGYYRSLHVHLFVEEHIYAGDEGAGVGGRTVSYVQPSQKQV